MLNLKMARITVLHDLNLKEHSGEFYVSFSDFVAYLKKNHKPSDNMKNIKTCNVCREFERYTHAFKVVDDATCIRLHSILRYIFSHTDNLEICKKVSAQLTMNAVRDEMNDQDASTGMLKISQLVINSQCFQ